MPLFLFYQQDEHLPGLDNHYTLWNCLANLLDPAYHLHCPRLSCPASIRCLVVSGPAFYLFRIDHRLLHNVAIQAPCETRGETPLSFVTCSRLTLPKTLYIYLGIAGLVGIAFGLGLHFLYGLLHSTLRLGSKPRVWGPTAKEHRAAWRNKKAAKEANESLMYSPSTAMDDISPKRRRGLLSQTIHEEIDSDF